MDNEDEFMEDDEINSQYGEEDNQMEYGSIDDNEDIGVNNRDGNDDDDQR